MNDEFNDEFGANQAKANLADNNENSIDDVWDALLKEVAPSKPSQEQVDPFQQVVEQLPRQEDAQQQLAGRRFQGQGQ